MDVETNIRNFYNNFPYPSFNIKTKSDLDKLSFQRFLFEVGGSYTKQQSKILDAGCGTGELALLFASKGFESYGTDISEKSIKIAKDASEKLGLTADFKKMDVLKLDFPKNYFDLTVCNGVLHHTKDPILGFENLVRVTKPNGTIMIVVYNKYGSIPRRVAGKIARLLGGNSQDKQVRFLRKFSGKRFLNRSDSVVADTFLNPYELSFTIREILSWFKKYKIEYKESAPPIELEYYPKVISEIIKKHSLRSADRKDRRSFRSADRKDRRSLLEAWLAARKKVEATKFSYNQLSFSLVQLLWLLSLRGNIFLIIGRKSRD